MCVVSIQYNYTHMRGIALSELVCFGRKNRVGVVEETGNTHRTSITFNDVSRENSSCVADIGIFTKPIRLYLSSKRAKLHQSSTIWTDSDSVCIYLTTGMH